MLQEAHEGGNPCARPHHDNRERRITGEVEQIHAPTVHWNLGKDKGGRGGRRLEGRGEGWSGRIKGRRRGWRNKEEEEGNSHQC